MRSPRLTPTSNKGSTIHKNSIKAIVLGASDSGKTGKNLLLLIFLSDCLNFLLFDKCNVDKGYLQLKSKFSHI